MSQLLDWLSRVVMLVLAGLVTLSIIGSIAAIPSGSLPSRIGLDGERQPAAPIARDPQAAAEPGETEAQPPSAGPGTGTGAAAAPAALEPPRWLEAITYALIALAGIAALACLLLWRLLHEHHRIADALERISSR